MWWGLFLLSFFAPPGMKGRLLCVTETERSCVPAAWPAQTVPCARVHPRAPPPGLLTCILLVQGNPEQCGHSLSPTASPGPAPNGITYIPKRLFGLCWLYENCLEVSSGTDVSSLAATFAQEYHTSNSGATLVLLTLVFIKMFIFYPLSYV